MILTIALAGATLVALGLFLDGNAARVCYGIATVAFGIAFALDLFNLA